jgi:hypothetical protein
LRQLATGVALALLLASTAPGLAEATTWTRNDAKNTYKNALGVTLMTHTAIVQWTGDGKGKLISSPKSLDNSTYQFTGVTRTGVSAKWSWYTAGKGGTGQAVNKASWLIGIPTPWGGIGTTHESVIINQVNGYGAMGRIQ